MMKKIKLTLQLLVILAFAAFTGCNLDITNPNTPTEEQVLTTAEGLKAVSVGMQGRLAIGIDDPIIIPGLLAGEFSANSNSFANDREFQDAVIIEDNASVRLLWSHAYQTIKSANDILFNIDDVTLSDGTRNGMTALAKTIKAIEFTILLQSGFQQIPVETYNTKAPKYVTKDAAMDRALTLLADAKVKAANVSDEFNSDILGAGFDLMNTIKMYQARLSLMKGDYANAATFAASVDAGATSQLAYSAINKNPLTDNFHTRNMFGVPANWRADAEAGDTRIDVLFSATSYNGGLDWPNADENNIYSLNLWAGEQDPYDLFKYGEAVLIQAEAAARTNDLPTAVTNINIIRSAAGLANFASSEQAAVLDEILKQRQYELFATGVSLEDLRRFGKINQAKVAWLPYPQLERDSNPNTPANP